MDTLTYVLISLFELWALRYTKSAIQQPSSLLIRTQPIDTLLKRLVATIAPSQIDTCTDIIGAHNHAHPVSPGEEHSIASAQELIGAIENLLRSSAIDTSALQLVEHVVNDARFLRAAAQGQQFSDCSLEIESPNFFDFIAELRFQPGEELGQIVIIGFFDENLLNINQFRHPQPLRQIKVSYSGVKSEVLLEFANLKTQCSGEVARSIQHRWQSIGAKEDISVYEKYRNDKLFIIKTRVISEELYLRQVRLIIGQNINLISTAFFRPSNLNDAVARFVRALR